MTHSASPEGWTFFRFGLIVTGKGEREFLPQLFRSLMATRKCTFEVIGQIGQRSPITSEKRILRMVGSGKKIPDRDEQDIGLPARRYLTDRNHAFVILVDDLESSRSAQAKEVFQRYRGALDTLLTPRNLAWRAAAHFFVNMLEAYYFADAKAINSVLGTALSDHDGDVETIRHPKRELKELAGGFDEVADGGKILAVLDVPHVLSNPQWCASLRTLFGWCWKAIGETPSQQYQLAGGTHSAVTGGQIDDLPG